MPTEKQGETTNRYFVKRAPEKYPNDKTPKNKCNLSTRNTNNRSAD